MHLGHSDEPPLIAPQRWGAIKGGLVLQFVDPQQGRISLAVADPGEGPGEPTPAPLSFRPNWGPKGQKKFLWRPLSQGLDPALSSSLLRPSYKI